MEVAGVDNGVNTVPNPPSLTPSGGSREYLWIAVGTLRSNIGSSRSITGAPTNYSNLNGDLIANSSGHVAVGTAERTLTASSENPGSFSVDSSSSVYAAGVTISIEPLEFRDASLTIALSTGMAVVANTITLRDAAIAIALSTTMAVSAQVATVVNAAVSIALTTTMAVQAGLLTFRDAAITIPVQITMAVAAGVATFVNAAISIALTTTMSVAARIRSFLIPKSRTFRITGVRHDPKRDRVTWDGEEV